MIMFITLKCKNCGEIQKVELDDLCKELLYKCRNCDTIMTERESTKIVNLETLENFEIFKIENGDSNSDFHNFVFTSDLDRITEIYCEADNDLKREITNIVDAIYLILNRKNIDDATTLHNMIRNYQLSKVESEQGESDTHSLVNTYKSFDELVSYIEEKIPGYSINASGLNKLKALFNKYDFDLLLECVDISCEQYLEYDDEDKPTKDSVGDFFEKIGGIAYNKSLSPILKKVGYIINYGYKVAYGWKKQAVKALLERYIVTLKEYGYNENEIISDLQDYVIPIIDDTCDWRQWDNIMEERIKMFSEENE